MKHLEKVREALDKIAAGDLSHKQNCAAIEAWAALSAHEQEVAELVTVARICLATLPYIEARKVSSVRELEARLTNTLRPFGDEK